MKFGIDLRFYSETPYGLSIYIKNSIRNFLPKLIQNNKISQIVLFFDKNIDVNYISHTLPVNDSKIKLKFSKAKYYSFAEQLLFCKELYSENIDLMYFFTPNYPILYNKSFIYQIMDTTLLRHKKWYSIQSLALRLCYFIGLKISKYQLFLSDDARKSTEKIFQTKLTKYGVLKAGINEIYVNSSTNNELVSLKFNYNLDKSKEFSKEEFFAKNQIKKPYFHFISVFRPYKNLINLVKGFEKFNQDRKYQLILAGSEDSKYPEIVQELKQTKLFQDGDLILTGRITDEESILLIDNSQALIAPSLSEGFGLWLLESACRGIPVLASDIEVFREIIPSDCGIFFNPENPDNIAEKIANFIDLKNEEKLKLMENGYKNAEKYNWNNVSEEMLKAVDQCLK
jgi:glycosyltransferase involved in cell wall biosynthesis